jgi:hypothetical protein
MAARMLDVPVFWRRGVNPRTRAGASALQQDGLAFPQGGREGKAGRNVGRAESRLAARGRCGGWVRPCDGSGERAGTRRREGSLYSTVQR